MTAPSRTADTIVRLSPRIEVLPLLHGSGDLAQEVRETLIGRHFDCLAVPLPPSVEPTLERAVQALPRISLVVLEEPDLDGRPACSFVPVDPCQAVIMGVRVAMGEGIARAYIDREVVRFEPTPFSAPDPYALKRVSLPAFAAALVPALPAPPQASQQADRIAWMAFRLHELELEYGSILCLCHLADWPWLRAAYQERRAYAMPERGTGRPSLHSVAPSTLYFILGELPYITELYERRRAELRSDRHLSVDGIKELVLEARSRWLAQRAAESRSLPNWVTPQLLKRYLQYVRNLALLERRLTPDLYTLILGMKQMAGDEFAVTLLETAKTYAFQSSEVPAAVPYTAWPDVAAGIGLLEFSDGRVATAKNRLQGPPLVWRTLALKPAPSRPKSRRWALQWNPFRQCSWPPEDSRIESFTGHVREQARSILGADLARVEKFTTSVKDGIDLRETLRHWPASRRFGPAGPGAQPPGRMDLYVKEIPPARGNVEVVVFLFDTPADPAVYSWQGTWYAEHEEESTLCFYASPFREQMVGPGIGQSRYGGALFLFPPRPIPNIWEDPRLAFTRTLEEKLIAAAALHSREPHVALVTPIPPLARWRHLLRRFQRRAVSIPLGRFGGQTVERLRHFHVLNGHEIRSYAARFIRE